MEVPFDILAPNYDTEFTNTRIGQMQRAQVWKYLDMLTVKNVFPSVLEINCGTGEDAVYFAKKGYDVTATDISIKMVENTANKARVNKVKINTQQCNMLDIGTIFPTQSFDLIFSNFGGLNCVSPLQLNDFVHAIQKLLKPHGHFIAVIMPRYCAWETLYFLTTLKIKKSFRRWTKNAVNVQFQTTNFPIWYYNPQQFAHFFKNYFQVQAIKPIGTFIPPSYLNSFFNKRANTLSILGKMEKKIENNSFAARFSDHFLIDLLKTND